MLGTKKVDVKSKINQVTKELQEADNFQNLGELTTRLKHLEKEIKIKQTKEPTKTNITNLRKLGEELDDAMEKEELM